MKNFGTARERYTGLAKVPLPQRAAVSDASAALTSDPRIGDRKGFSSLPAALPFNQAIPSSTGEKGVSEQATNLSNTTRARMVQVFHLHVVTQDPPVCHPERSRGGSAARSCASAARTTARSTSSNVGSAATNNSLQFSISVRFNSECG